MLGGLHARDVWPELLPDHLLHPLCIRTSALLHEFEAGLLLAETGREAACMRQVTHLKGCLVTCCIAYATLICIASPSAEV
jgi:hypothetical protein